MSIKDHLRVALLPALLALATPAFAKDLLIVSVEAIKQAAVNAVLDAHPEVFEDELLIDAGEHNITIVCLPDRFLQEATSVEQHIRRCSTQFRFLLRDSIELQQFVDENGYCYERRTAIGYSVNVYPDGTSPVGEISGPGGRTTAIDCEGMLNSANDKTRESVHRPVPLEVVPGIAERPPGPGLFHIDMAGIREAALAAAIEAYPEYAEGGLLPDEPDKPMLLPCHSIVEPSGESAVPGAHLCFAHVEFRIADSLETAPFLADDGTCHVASKYLGIKVAVGEDGAAVVGRPTFGCGGGRGEDVECDPGQDAVSEEEAWDAWCQPGEKQAQ